MNQVLVVDDDAGILEALEAAIEALGFEVIILEDAEKTLAVAKDIHPQIILMDLLMSGSDGAKITSELKRHTETKDIPIIMVSAHPTAEQQAKACGADGFLAKPFDIDQLFQALNSHI